MNKKIIDELLMVNNDLILPNYLIKYMNKLDLNVNELIVLLYLINSKERVVLDLKKISEELYIDENSLLDIVNNLIEKKYISIEMSKEKGIIEEFISLDLFFSIINSLLIEKDTGINANDIYTKFEKQFGRPLSPIEYETINKWIQSNIPEDLIESALNEAVLSGVNSIRYIDKILFEWNKKGYKAPNDNTGISDEEIEQIYDYDWLNE